MTIAINGSGVISGVTSLSPYAQPRDRNKLINSNFSINQLVLSGTVTLSAGQYGHDGFKAGSNGCTYTFSKTDNDTTISISAGSLIQTVPAERIYGGTYTLSWVGTALGKIGSGSYSASPVTATGIVGATSLNVEWSPGTLTFVQLENTAYSTSYERKDRDIHQFDCEYFYQTSYEDVPPGTPAATNGRLTVLAASTSSYCQFLIFFTRQMYSRPTVTLYNPSSGAINGIRDETIGGNYTAGPIGLTNSHRRQASFQSTVAPPASSTMSAHFTAAART